MFKRSVICMLGILCLLLSACSGSQVADVTATPTLESLATASDAPVTSAASSTPRPTQPLVLRPTAADEPTENPPTTVPPQVTPTAAPSDQVPQEVWDLLEEMSDYDIREYDFALTDLNGREHSLTGYIGKTVVLSFWATWCGPCQGEMPYFQSLHAQGPDDVVVLTVVAASVEGLSPSETEQAVRDFVGENGYTMTVLMDPDDAAWSIYQQRGIPANYLIDARGIMRYVLPGAYADEQQLLELVDNVRLVGQYEV